MLLAALVLGAAFVVALGMAVLERLEPVDSDHTTE